MTCNFQDGKNKIKLFTEYESVTQKVLLLIEVLLQNDKQLQHARICFVVPYKNLESHRVSKYSIRCVI
jgi:hypothetical protein